MDQVTIEFSLFDEEGETIPCDEMVLVGWDEEQYGVYAPTEDGGIFSGELASFATAGDLSGHILVTKVTGPKGTCEGWDALRKYRRLVYN